MLPTGKSYFIPELLLPPAPIRLQLLPLKIFRKTEHMHTLCEMNQERVGLASATIELSLSGERIVNVAAGSIFR